jgi:hypothetical protein
MTKKELKHVMTDADFNEALEAQVMTAQQYLADVKTDNFTATFVTYELDDKGGEPGKPRMVIHLMAEFGGEVGRMLLAALGHKKAMDQVMVNTCFVVAEAWMGKYEADKGMPYKQVADDPQRQEIVIVAGMTVDGRLNQAQIKFDRDADNIIIPGEVNYMRCGGKDISGHKNALCGTFFDSYLKTIESFRRDYQIRNN